MPSHSLQPRDRVPLVVPRCILATSLFAGPVAIGAQTPQTTFAQGTTLLAADTLALACAADSSNVWVKKTGPDSIASKESTVSQSDLATVQRFCTATGKPLAGQIAVPSAEIIRRVVQAIKPPTAASNPDDTTHRNVQVDEVGPTTTFVAGTPLTLGTASVEFVDYAFNAAQQEVTDAIIHVAAQTVCARAVFDKLAAQPISLQSALPATCKLLSSGTAQDLFKEGLALPSFGAISATLKQDVVGLPTVVLNRVEFVVETQYRSLGVRQYGNATADLKERQNAERAVIALAGAQLGVVYVQQRDPVTATDATVSMLNALADSLFAATGPSVANTVATRIPPSDSAQAHPAPTARQQGAAKDTTSGAAPKSGGVATAPFTPVKITTCGDKWQRLGAARDFMAGVAGASIALHKPSSFTGLNSDSVVVVNTLRALLVNAREGTNVAAGESQSALCASLPGTFTGDNLTFATADANKWAAWRARIITAVPAISHAIASTDDALSGASGDRLKVRAAYAAGAGDLIEAFEPFFAPADTNATLGAITTLAERAAKYPSYGGSQSYGSLVSDVIGLVGDVLQDDPSLSNSVFSPQVGRIALFALDASQAKDANGFRDALVQYAEPGSTWARVRAKGGWYITTMVGVNAGREWTNIPAQPATASPASPAIAARSDLSVAYGAELPLGVEKMWSQGSYSAGLFFQVFDLGQLASWRTANPGTLKEGPPGLTFGSIFSPGIGGLIALPHVPISIGALYAYAPELRDLTVATAQQARASAQRLLGFVAVDVPIFQLSP